MARLQKSATWGRFPNLPLVAPFPGRFGNLPLVPCCRFVATSPTMSAQARLVLVIALWLLVGGGPAGAADPDWYVRKGTWQATMRASLEAFHRGRDREPAGQFEPFTSDVIQGGEPARHVRLPIRGVKQLTLTAKGVPDYSSAHADWADARLVAADGRVTYVSDLKPIRVNQPYGTLRADRSHRGGPIRIADRQFDRGLGTHAFSEICFSIDGKYEWFEAWIGVDVTAGTKGHVQFTITDQPDAEIEAVRGALWRLVQRDFPDCRQEMEWEREDGIWNRPLGVKNLAERYAAVSTRAPELYRQAARRAADVRDEAGLEEVRRLYLQRRGAGVRQLCFEQDHDFNPAVLPMGPADHVDRPQRPVSRHVDGDRLGPGRPAGPVP